MKLINHNWQGPLCESCVVSVLPAAHRGQAGNIYPVVVWEIPHYLSERWKCTNQSTRHKSFSEVTQSAVLRKGVNVNAAEVTFWGYTVWRSSYSIDFMHFCQFNLNHIALNHKSQFVSRGFTTCTAHDSKTANPVITASNVVNYLFMMNILFTQFSLLFTLPMEWIPEDFQTRISYPTGWF